MGNFISNVSSLFFLSIPQLQLTVTELLKNSCNIAADDAAREVIVYDQCTQDASGLPTESFLSVLLSKLSDSYKSVWLLSGKL